MFALIFEACGAVGAFGVTGKLFCVIDGFLMGSVLVCVADGESVSTVGAALFCETGVVEVFLSDFFENKR